MLYGVALMESPHNDRVRTSTGSSTIIRASETESNLDYFEAVHSVTIDTNAPFVFGGESSPGRRVMVTHELMKSPLPSIAPTHATTASLHRQKYRVLGTLSLVGILYLSTCGGPVGSEPIISIGGPLIGLLGITGYVIFCQIPISFMVTELCCAFPENGGYAVWAMTAFGPFWGFQVGYWSWVASVINNSIYPSIIYGTVTKALGVEATSGVVAYLIQAVIAILLAAPSFIGVRFMGIAALVALLLVLGISLLFSVWGLAAGDHAWFRLAEVRSQDEANVSDGTIDWSLLIHTLFWSFDGLHWISMIGGEVRNPARTYPRVVAFTVLLTALSYLLPAIAAVTANKTPWRDMVEDSYPQVANAIGGFALDKLFVVSSVLSLGGLFACTVFLQSFLVQGMAQSQLLPGVLRKRHARFKTPQYALLVGLLATLVLLSFEFETMQSMANTFSSSVQVVIVFTMLQLRRAFPYLSRPVRVPGNLATLTVMLLPPLAVFCFAIGSTLVNWERALVVVAFALPGLAFPHVRGWLAGRQLCG